MARMAEDIEAAELKPDFLIPEGEIVTVNARNIGYDKCEYGCGYKYIAT